MNQKDLNEVLRLHKLWTNKKKGGVRANLSSERLKDVSLSNANLSFAILTDANLSGADLSRANLFRANLAGASLTGANLFRANLSGANLENANLEGASLYLATLIRANLTRANLSDANLTNADLSDAILPDFQVPQSGDLVGYKKVVGGVILELLIPDGSRRTGSLIGSKCRCERALVVRALHSDLTVVRALHSDLTEFRSMHDSTFMYKVGEFVEEQNYNPDPREECLPGIHFFLTKEEAESY